MKGLKDNKIIGCIALVVILFLVSFFIYGQGKDRVFKDEYMKDIFVDEEGIESNNNEEKIEKVNTKTEKNNSSNETDEVILKKSEITVEIKGEVKTPKVYTLEEGAIINDLIEKAGGLTSEANISNINRAKILKNEDLIIVGNINSLEENIKVEGSNSGVITSVNSGGESSGTININTATSGELMNIDGVGEKTAQKIIDYREENGAFKTIEDIKNVDRIGDKTFENMKDQISC